MRTVPAHTQTKPGLQRVCAHAHTHTVNSAFRRQDEDQGFKVILSYTVSSGPTQATRGQAVLGQWLSLTWGPKLNSRAHGHACILTASQLTQPVRTQPLLAYQACCSEFKPQNPGEVGKPPDKAKDSIPGACWPVNLAELVSLRFSERPCLNMYDLLDFIPSTAKPCPHFLPKRVNTLAW